MKIVWQEMKKILSVRKLLYLAGFYVLYFVLFLKPYVYSHYNSSYHEEAELVKSFIAEYGTSLTPEEFEELKSRRPEYEYDEIDQYIASSPTFTTLGIHDFQELMNALGEKKVSLEEYNQLWFTLYDVVPEAAVPEKMMRLNTYQTWNQYIETYERETAGGTIYYQHLDQAGQERVKERGQKEVYGLVPNNVVYNNFEVLRFTGAFMVLGMLFMIMPYMVAENRSRMPSLQYSFRKGRSTYGSRMVAVLLSCMLITALTVVAYGKIAVSNQVLDFWNCSISAYSTAFISWFPWTLGQYTVFHLLLAAAFSTGLSLAVFVVTHYLENYVTAIAWVLPAVIGGAFFCGFAMYAFGEITRSKWLVPLIGMAVLGLGFLVAILQGLREKRRDVGMI